MACAEMVSDPLLVAAIDFGTCFSGCAFALRDHFKEDPSKISVRKWASDGSISPNMPKTPTSVLFDGRGEFHSFGYDAESDYSALLSDQSHGDWYFFRRFKMQLYRNHEITPDSTIKDENGKQMPALKIISECIRYMRDYLLKEIAKNDLPVKKTEITWVLTVPAIWSDPAKQFMKEAAVKAGIPNSQLILALEPEAASIYCKHLFVETLADGAKSVLGAFSPGNKYLILDAGGGTLHITVQEVQTDGSIKQLYMANGGELGGTKIDEACKEYIMEFFGPDIVHMFCSEDKDGYTQMCKNIEDKMNKIKPEEKRKCKIKVSPTLRELFERENESDSHQLFQSKGANLKCDHLVIDPDVARGFFDKACQQIVDHLKGIFEQAKVRCTNTILMVGGFSESPMLRDAVEKGFPGKTIIIPQESGLAVLKGAVQYGYEPGIIPRRVEINVSMPDPRGGNTRKVFVQLTFCGTEVEVKATNKGTGEELISKLNFLR